MGYTFVYNSGNYQPIRIFLFCLLLSQVVACQLFMPIENNNNMKEKYVWDARSGAPLGYPIAVYAGGFILKGGTLVDLYSGISTARSPWGTATGGMERAANFPHRLKVTWISFAEDCEYRIDVPLDAQKIEDIFKEGYLIRNAYGDLMESNYDEIVAGFAPGGVVSVWVEGGGASREVGFFKGEKIKIPRSITDSLEPSERNWFDPAYRKKIMETPAAVPREVQEKNKNKPIPYGLWDRYRNRYQWKPVFTLPEGAALYDVTFVYLNGNVSDIYYPNINTLPEEYKDCNFVPRFVTIEWTTKEGKNKIGLITFEQEKIMEAFEKFTDQDSLELEFYVNQNSSFISVLLKGNGQTIGLIDQLSQVEVRDVEKIYKRN